MLSTLERTLILTNESDRSILQQMGGILDKDQQSIKDSRSLSANPLPKLVSPYGDEIELPLFAFEVLKQTIYHLAQNKAVSITPISKELSIQEAANFLGVSRSYLVGLLDSGKLPFVKEGTVRRLLLSDLLEYQKCRDEERRQGLTEIAHISEDEELYNL